MKHLSCNCPYKILCNTCLKADSSKQEVNEWNVRTAPTIWAVTGLKQCEIVLLWNTVTPETYSMNQKCISYSGLISIKDAKLSCSGLTQSISTVILQLCTCRHVSSQREFTCCRRNVGGEEERQRWNEWRWQSCLQDKCGLSPVKRENAYESGCVNGRWRKMWGEGGRKGGRELSPATSLTWIQS